MFERFVLVDYLKFIAVLLIVVDHGIEVFIGFNWLIWLLGALGVSLFIYSAGFLADKSASSPFNPKQYLVKRVLKLYPLYLLASVFAIGLSDVSSFQQLSNLVMIYPLFWFVPIILILYVLFTAYKIRFALFAGLASIYTFVLLSLAVYMAVNGNYEQTLFYFYWVFLLALFFKGVKTQTLKANVPRVCFIETVSTYSYPIYLFQYAFLLSAVKMGFSLSFLYVGLAVATFLLLKWELKKYVKT